jgi:transcriptional regulator with XRE-family HTH domain
MIFDKEKFALDIYQWRVKNRYSLRDAGKIIGVSAPTLSRIENYRLPDIETFTRVITFFDRSPQRYFKEQ